MPLAIHGGPAVVTEPWPAWPIHTQAVEDAALELLRSGEWWARSHGEATEYADVDVEPPSRVGRFQRAFARMHGARYGMAAANGTVTLEVALAALDIGPGDEVVIPALTFAATGTSVIKVGATPRFVDVDPGTFNMDPARVEEAITPRTRAIMPVHFGGQPAAMREIGELARRHGLRIVEDAAQAHLGSYLGRPCGSLGDIGSFSFQGSKNLTAGEGGMLTTSDRGLAVACEEVVWGGRVSGGDWYAHYRLGSNFRMTELQAAILSAQLADLEGQLEVRERNAYRLDQLLGTIDGITPSVRSPETTAHPYHIYSFRYDASRFAGVHKADFVRALHAEGIPGASTGYKWPIYRNPVFGLSERDLGELAERCPVSERACTDDFVCIPQPMLLAGPEQIDRICEAVAKVHDHASEFARRIASA